MIVNDISEIWSLELAYVDKLAKYKRGVLQLLIAVDCLPRCLQVEPLKTKSAKTAEFKGEFESSHTTLKVKKSAFAERIF